MNLSRIYIYVVVALVASTLLLLPAFSSSITSNVTVPSSGAVAYSASGPSTPINKAISILQSSDLSSSQIALVGNHFNLFCPSYGNSGASLSSLQQIKAINPNIKIIVYQEFIAVYPDENDILSHAQESWFVHDSSGNRITSSAFGWYLMNFTNSGWMQFISSYWNNLTNTPYVNGIFGDDAWYSSASGPLSGTIASSSFVSNWHQNMITYIEYIKAHMLSGKILILNYCPDFVNGFWSNTDYTKVADGIMLEGYQCASWQSSGRESIGDLAAQSSTGKIIYCSSSGSNSSALIKYCYCSFLLGMNDSQCYWEWNSDVYDPIMDTNIGSATGSYYSSQNVYMRDFTSGKVLFNPSSNSYTVNLGSNYKLLNGTVVSSVVLAPYSGEILLPST